MRRMALKARKIFSCPRGRESGQILILVLILIILGAVILTPLLSFTIGGLKQGQAHDEKKNEFYAADTGIEDATWWIGKDRLSDKFPNDPAYSPYDFSTVWGYRLPEKVNDQTVDVTIANVWIPTDIAVPSVAVARRIIEGDGSADPRLIVGGNQSTSADSTYQIKISYYPLGGESLAVKTLGVWLPNGYEYVGGSSNIDDNITKAYYAVPVVTVSHAGGQSVVWDLKSYPFAGSDAAHPPLPGVSSSDTPMVCTITFRYTSQQTDVPGAVAWITTNSAADAIPFSWDYESRVFRITSTATSADGKSTTVESHIPQIAARKMASAVNGDYYATGNSLLTDANHDNEREHLLTSSSSTVSAIPADADVAAAYLYWSAWRDIDQIVTKAPLNPDYCTTYSNWNRSATTSWGLGSSWFSGHSIAGYTDASKTLTLKNSISTSPRVDVSWDQWVAALTEVTFPGYPDGCTTWNNWTAHGSAWDLATYSGTGSGTFRGFTNGKTSPGLDLTSNALDLTSAGSTGSVDISWNQYVSTAPVFSDPGTSPINTYWQNGSDWMYSSGYYRGQRVTSSTDTSKLLTRSQDLSYYSGGDLTLSWDWWTSSSMTPSSAGLALQVSNDGGTNWTTPTGCSFTGTKTTHETKSYSIPADYLTANFKMRFVLAGTGAYGNSKYCYVDNIAIKVNGLTNLTPSDGLDVSYYNGSSWTTLENYRGPNAPSSSPTYTIPEGNLPSNFKLRFSLVGFDAPGQYCYLDNINIVVSPTYSSSDGLDFAVSGDGGTTWSGNIQAFRYGDSFGIGTSSKTFSYTVPSQYSTSTFRIRFYLVGFQGQGKYCNVDNIKVTVMAADGDVVFKIGTQQVYFDSAGLPQQGAQKLTSERTDVVQNWVEGVLAGYNYCCFRDVTDLVREYSPKAPDPAINYPGNAMYTVGDVTASLTSQTIYSAQTRYAGWSLIIIYQGPTTVGHQLYLFDAFSTNPHYDDLDFDGDGARGGTVSGFLVPNKIPGEVNVAKMTCFVVEGDDQLTGDFIALNAPQSYWAPPANPENIPNSYKLWDGNYSTEVPGSNTITNPSNVWNGKSWGGLGEEGVDVDTFDVTWASGRLNTGDTSAHIDMYTENDGWTLVYIILSFRSQVTTGGSISYLIRG